MKKILSILITTVLLVSLAAPYTVTAAKEFDVDGVTKSIENDPGFVNDVDPRLIYKGPWSKNQFTPAGGKASNGGRDWTSFYAGGGRAYLAEVKGATVEFTFVGTSIMVLMTRYKDLGSVEFTLDGGAPVRADMDCGDNESDDNYVAYKKTGLTPGVHTIRMESVYMAEKKDGKETLGYIHLIGLVTDNGIINSTNTNFVTPKGFSVNEENAENQMSCGCVGDDLLYTNKKSSTLTVNFQGKYVGILSKVGNNFGTASVAIDGKDMGTIDLQADKTAIQKMVFAQGGLSDGKHTMTITTKDDKYFNVDAIIVSKSSIAQDTTSTLSQAAIITSSNKPSSNVSKNNTAVSSKTSALPTDSASAINTSETSVPGTEVLESADATQDMSSVLNAASDSEVVTPKPKKSSAITIVIVVMIVLLLGIGGIAAWLLYFKPKMQK